MLSVPWRLDTPSPKPMILPSCTVTPGAWIEMPLVVLVFTAVPAVRVKPFRSSTALVAVMVIAAPADLFKTRSLPSRYAPGFEIV